MCEELFASVDLLSGTRLVQGPPFERESIVGFRPLRVMMRSRLKRLGRVVYSQMARTHYVVDVTRAE